MSPSSEMSHFSATPASGKKSCGRGRQRPSKREYTMRASGTPVISAGSTEATSVSLPKVKSAGGNWLLRTAQVTAARPAISSSAKNQVRPSIDVIYRDIGGAANYNSVRTHNKLV